MNTLKKIGLFLSSFSPLFILIIFKEIIEIANGNWSFNFLNTSVLIILLMFFIYGVFTLCVTINEIRGLPNINEIIITDKKNTTDQHFLGYFSLFVLFAVSFEIEMYSMASIFFIVLLFIGIVYIKNDMYYINPFINILGYSFYDIEYKNENHQQKKLRVFYKGRMIIGQKYIVYDKYLNFIFLICKKDLEK